MCIFFMGSYCFYSQANVKSSRDQREKWFERWFFFFFSELEVFQNNVFLGQKGSVAIWNFVIRRSYDNFMWKVLRWFRSLSRVCMVQWPQSHSVRSLYTLMKKLRLDTLDFWSMVRNMGSQKYVFQDLDISVLLLLLRLHKQCEYRYHMLRTSLRSEGLLFAYILPKKASLQLGLSLMQPETFSIPQIIYGWSLLWWSRCYLIESGEKTVCS